MTRWLMLSFGAAIVGCGGVPARPLTAPSTPTAEPPTSEAAVAEPVGVRALVETLVEAQAGFDQSVADGLESGIEFPPESWVDASAAATYGSSGALHAAAVAGVWSEELNSALREVALLSGQAGYERELDSFDHAEESAAAAREALHALLMAVDAGVATHEQATDGASRQVRCLGSRAHAFVSWSSLRVHIARQRSQLYDGDGDEDADSSSIASLDQLRGKVERLLPRIRDLSLGVDDLDSPSAASLALVEPSAPARTASVALAAMRDACAWSGDAPQANRRSTTAASAPDAASRAAAEQFFALGGSSVGMASAYGIGSGPVTAEQVVEVGARATRLADALLAQVPAMASLELDSLEVEEFMGTAWHMLAAIGANQAAIRGLADSDPGETARGLLEKSRSGAQALRKVVEARAARADASTEVRCIAARMGAYDAWIERQGEEEQLARAEAARESRLMRRALEALAQPNAALGGIAAELTAFDQEGDAGWEAAVGRTRGAAEVCGR